MSWNQIVVYLSPEPHAFWQWTEGCETITWWTLEQTIAFHEEIETAVRHLSPFGLPLFPEIILVLAACRKNWNEPGGGKSLFAEFLQSLDRNPLAPVENEAAAEWIRPLLEGLDHVHRLAVERPSLERKCLILEILFEEGPYSIESTGASSVAGALGGNTATLGLPVRETPVSGPISPSPIFIRTIQSLLTVLPRLEELESLSHRERTGLDHPVEPAEGLAEELSDADAARSLILDLEDRGESELTGLARVARNLLGVLNVPRALADPEDLPLGGFSDIANRGDLDRLLLTELAQDDEVLALRVALNEAMYLRRESPPRNPPRDRRILIDNGIRLWGIPRAFAHSAALALAANAGASDRVQIVSTDSSESAGPEPGLARNTVRGEEDLIEALSRLDPAPHPGERIIDFLDEEKEGEDATASESIVITHPEVLRDESFQRILRGRRTVAPFFIVTVDGLGHLRLLMRTAAGDRLLQQVKLDPADLQGGDRPCSLRHRRNRLNPELPQILGYDPLPLLMAHPIAEKRAWISPQGDIVTLTRKGLLYHYTRRDRGARQVCDSLALRGHCLIGVFDNDWLILAFGQSAEPRIVAVDLVSGETVKHRLSLLQPVLSALYVSGTIVFFTSRKAIAIDAISGEERDRIGLNVKPRRTEGRFAQIGNDWHAVAVGAGLTITPVTLKQRFTPIALVFDCPLHPAPLVLLQDGRVHIFDGDRNPVLPFTDSSQQFLSVIGLADEGRKLFFRSNASFPEISVYDFAKEEVRRGSWSPPRDRVILEQLCRIPSLRKKVSGLRITGSTEIVLLSRKSKSAPPVMIFRMGDQFVLRQIDAEPPGRNYFFEPIESPAAGYDLSAIRFPDGSAAFLDSRGMLHLKSGDPSVPEITLVLRDQGMISGWLSTGEFFGQPYFIGDHAPVPASEIERHLLRMLGSLSET